MVLVTLLIPAAALTAAHAGQRVLQATDAWIQPGDGDTADAYAVIENGTMYEIYVVGAESPNAGSVRLMQMADGKAAPITEVSIPAFDRLEMSPDGTFLRLSGLKQPLKAGESLTISLRTDSGETLTVTAKAKK